MDIVLICVGKGRIGYVADGISEYQKRLKRYVPYAIEELPDVKNAGKLTESEQKEAEGVALLAKMQPSDYVILLDERGKEYASREFSEYLQRIMAGGRKRALFVVGGPYGFSEKVYQRADAKISLSKMTFNHEMVRLFFTEQVYRAMTILRGEPYHHD